MRIITGAFAFFERSAATAVNTELAKPQVEPSRLAQLAGQLGDLEKQVGTLKGVMK